MTQPPLGQVCLRLGLMDGPQVERVLQEMREHGQGRFGELAVELNLLTEESLARALADQFHVPLLPADRLARITVPRDVLALLPASLIRGGLLVPTWLDLDRRTLSVITSDPTDLPSLQAVLRCSRADRLRIFVAARSGLVALIDRLLPAGTATDDEDLGDHASPEAGRRAGTVVLEGDVEVAAALRRLDRAEGNRSLVVQDPEQVTAVLRAGQADRVLLRDNEASSAAAYLPSWVKAREGVQIATVRGYGPSRRFVLDYRTSRSFYHELVIRLLASGPGASASEGRLRRAARLALELGREVDLSDEVGEAMALLAVLAVSSSGEARPGASASRQADELLSGLSSPWDLDGLRSALERRINRPAEVSEHLPCETLLLASHLLEPQDEARSAELPGLDPRFRYHPAVLAAARRVLARRLLRAQLLSSGAREARVLLLCADPARSRQLERLLDGLGFELRTVPDPQGAERLLAELRPCLLLSEGQDLGLQVATLRDRARAVSCSFLRADGLSDGELLRQVRLLAASVVEGADRTPTATADSSSMAISELLHMLRDGGQTATIQLTRGGEAGLVRVVEGLPRTARLGAATGDEALERILALPLARYAIHFGQAAEEDDPALRVRGFPRA
jgi:hypothetical protein